MVYDLKKKFFITFVISCLVFGLAFIGIDKFVLGGGVETTADGEEIENKVEGELLVLFLGVDGNDLVQEKGLRTDTMILGKANFDTGDIDLLSIPRDTRVQVNGREDKINHAHSYGGPELAMKAVEDFLHIDIDYYVKVDFVGIKEIVDAIGGVKLNVPQRMYYYDPVAKPPLKIDLQPGEQTLDGKKAHDYLRFRSYPNGDIGRVEAQQYFMKELAKQLLSPKNLLRIDKLIKTYYDYVDTNISISTMLKYGVSAGKLNIESMRTEMVPGEAAMIKGGSYWIYDMLDTSLLVEDMFGDYIRKY